MAAEVSVSVVDSDPPPGVNSPVSLTCTVTMAEPAAAITWYKDGELMADETGATLTFTPTEDEFDARVECRADNGVVRSAAVTLDLQCKYCIECHIWALFTEGTFSLLLSYLIYTVVPQIRPQVFFSKMLTMNRTRWKSQQDFSKRLSS